MFLFWWWPESIFDASTEGIGLRVDQDYFKSPNGNDNWRFESSGTCGHSLSLDCFSVPKLKPRLYGRFEGRLGSKSMNTAKFLHFRSNPTQFHVLCVEFSWFSVSIRTRTLSSNKNGDNSAQTSSPTLPDRISPLPNNVSKLQTQNYRDWYRVPSWEALIARGQWMRTPDYQTFLFCFFEISRTKISKRFDDPWAENTIY